MCAFSAGFAFIKAVNKDTKRIVGMGGGGDNSDSE